MKAIRIPWRSYQPVTVAEVGDGWESMAAAIGDGCRYIERVQVQSLYPLVMVVDEEGLYTQEHNQRASRLYRGPTGIKGDALVLAEGMTAEGPDFVDLPDPAAALTFVQGVIR